MTWLYKKSELGFALACIGAYVFVFSLTDNVSVMIGMPHFVTMFVGIFMSVILMLWLFKSGLLKTYGLCKSEISAARFLYYIPLFVLISIHFWGGFVRQNDMLFVVSHFMTALCVGFLEELIFRGFLFTAMRRDSLKWAVIVSSVTFGMGHIVNLINGSGMSVGMNLLQIVYAIAAGFLFTLIFIKSKSLIVCMITHGLFNALSIFGSEDTVFSGVALCIVSLVYSCWLIYDSKKCLSG